MFCLACVEPANRSNASLNLFCLSSPSPTQQESGPGPLVGIAIAINV